MQRSDGNLVNMTVILRPCLHMLTVLGCLVAADDAYVT